MNSKVTPVPDNVGVRTKLDTFLRYLFAIDVLMFTFHLGAYVEGAHNGSLLSGAAAQIFLVGGLLNTINTGQSSKNLGSHLITWGLFALSLVVLSSRYWLPRY